MAMPQYGMVWPWLHGSKARKISGPLKLTHYPPWWRRPPKVAHFPNASPVRSRESDSFSPPVVTLSISANPVLVLSAWMIAQPTQHGLAVSNYCGHGQQKPVRTVRKPRGEPMSAGAYSPA
jgi:hypothetical protein